MKAGNSGATVERVILKKGRFCYEQARYCEYLGKEICPEILGTFEDGYLMEELQENINLKFGDYPIERHIDKLKEQCWTKEPPQWNANWQKELTKKMPILGGLIYAVYPEHQSEYSICAIHGDPTIANVLMREDHWIIADPIPPLQQTHIPCIKEVDLGKVYQSMLGWEAINFNWEIPPQDYKEYVLSQGNEPEEVLFWALVHLYRIIPYSQRNPKILKWVQDKIKEVVDELCI